MTDFMIFHDKMMMNIAFTVKYPVVNNRRYASAIARLNAQLGK